MANVRLSALMLSLGITLLTKVAHCNFCPDAKLCDCTPNYINCTCLKNETIDFVETSQIFTINELVINGCGRVHLKERCLADKEIQLARLSNLLELYVDQYAFQNGKIKDLTFHNIRNFVVEGSAFAGIKSITSLIMKNVALEEMASELFSDTTVPILIIKDSKIKTIAASSFQLKQSDKITIENTTIDTIETSSFRIELTKNFSFVYNSIQSTNTFSYTFTSVKNIQFRNCRINEIPKNMILTKKVEAFEFSKNYIRVCEEKAFSAMRECTSLSFISNQILKAKNNSLIPNEELSEGDLLGITSKNNEIGCDCDVEWLIATNNPIYVNFKEKNICHYPSNLKGLKLSLLEVERSKEDGCSSVGKVSFPATDIPAVTSTSVSETAGREGNAIIIDSYTVTTTDGGTDQSVEFSGGKLQDDEQDLCNDNEHSNNGSSRPYTLGALVSLLPLIILINRSTQKASLELI